MKRNLIRSCSLMILTVMLGVVSVQAQTLGAYDAQIPFDFTVGDKSYEAGDYIIRVKRPNYLADILVISDSEGRELQSAAVTRNGDRSKTDQARLLFARNGDHYGLRKVVAPGFGFSTLRLKEKVTVVEEEDPLPKPDTVSIVLKRRE